MRYSLWVLALLAVLEVGCATAPARWATDLREKAYCGMSKADVEKITGRKVVAELSSNGTHVIAEDGETTVSTLTFDGDRLMRIRISSTSKLLAVVPEQVEVIDLCYGRRDRIQPTYSQPR
jgi:hypothetical protein